MPLTRHALNREFAWEAHDGPFRRVTPAQAAAYDEAGFFVLEDAFDAATVRGMIAEIDPFEARVTAVLRGLPIFVEVPRGGVAFHHGLTFHVAKPNRTPRTRRVHTMIFFRDGCTRAAGGFHPSVDRAGIEAGQPIASSATPIA